VAHTAGSGLRKEKVLKKWPAGKDVNDEEDDNQDVLLFKDGVEDPRCCGFVAASQCPRDAAC
jgi:hypothetical protein